jgi:murein DD-endopeptidase MepM/ murein hydrolase activator NlpD
MPPPRPRLALLLLPVALALALLFVLLPHAAAGASGVHERWRWPVESRTLAGRFAYSPHHPFASAQRRGIDITAPRGAAVRAACGGRVAFAGPVPGGRGLGVTVRCGALVATHLGLGRLIVRRGARVAPGARIGAVGPAGRLRLGARVRAQRFGYVDPLGLLREERPPVAPLGRAPRGPGVPAPLRPAARPRPVTPAPVPRAGGAGVPAGAWAGLVVLAAGVPLGGLMRRSRRRRRMVLATTAAGER